ncbi:hypothetical protein [Paenibacillus radicis (ex Xue et al. 2023)]|uniref:BclA C-terminal domain-containing protein n=1 Tax=Paenibacillus radicis (ex Xue et al. 2023) TaxID=2972489 RepID=A0ABT1YCV2_9BACL|nr:hypothetical protein [Paenibacillus radicis (ex Xue et al. 2023)]MCR8631013.1 hypothetical protein [Paenibacillus radicis (ex Xue et al. 2023)]
MPNNNVYNLSNNPVYFLSTNTLSSPSIVAPPDNGAGQTGKLFVVTAINSTSLGLLGGSVIITLQANNGSGSGITMYLSSIVGGTSIALNLLSSFTATAAIIKGGTLTSPTTLTAVNTNFSSTNTSGLTIQSSTSAPSGGTPVSSFPLPPGMLSIPYNGGIVVPPGQSITVTISAALTVAGLLSSTATLQWWEA